MAITDIFSALIDLVAREPDGSNTDGDNDNSNDIGEVGDPYLRITPNSYVPNVSDGSNGGPTPSPVTTGVAGPNGMALPVAPTNPPAIPIPGQDEYVGELPQARAISDAVMALAADDQNHPSSFAVNELFDFFGQALTHDVAEASTAPTGEFPLLMDGLPFPFGRTGFETDADGVRQQLNEETSFLDLSHVYGNRQDREDLARAELRDADGNLVLDGSGNHIQSAKLLLGDDGLLPTIGEVAADAGITAREVLTIYQETGFAGLPNPATAADGTFEGIYYAGDNRATQQAPLVTLQTVWAREHNFQVDRIEAYLAETCQTWSEQQKFDAARAITEAEWQHVVFEEYVPKLIGTHADSLLDAYKATHPDPIPAGIINEWTTVAFRFGHDQSSNEYTVIDGDGNSTVITLQNAFSALGTFATGSGATTTAGIDAWIRGLAAQFTQEIDGKVADGNRNFLFGGLGGVVDLEAFDIQRGRDHGVGNYNVLREGLGLSAYASFDAFGAANDLDTDLLAALKTVYSDADGVEHIEWLDSIVGGLLEKKYADSQFGVTFTLLNALQFEALKAGDPFYYETRLAGSPELLAEIKGVTHAEILERNSGSTDDPGTVTHLHLDSFGVAREWTGSDSKRGDVHSGADDATYLNADLLIGGEGNDKLYGGKGNDTLYGDAGNDRLDGGGGDDFLKGGGGNDSLYGGWDDDHAWGEEGNDCIDLGAGDDWANGGAGNDSISCGLGNDIALGKEGNDALSGGAGNDELFAGDDNDLVSGDSGDDKCYGGAGNDCVAGDKGDDLIVGEAGNDTLSGGAGYDTFAFGAGSGKDRITDFNVRQDVIDLSELAQFDSFAAVEAAMTTNKRGTTIIDLGDTDYDGVNDTIELVGVSQKYLKESNFVLVQDDAAVA